jgi:hypothetical protein
MILYLAQVRKNTITNHLDLQLLAHKKQDNLWEFSNLECLSIDETSRFNEGMLVLLEVDDWGEIVALKDAKEWVLNLLQQYLMEESINHEFVALEKARVEQWRQEITTQSQDLTRLRLEIETRREQLEELEATLKIEREQLKSQGS